MTNKSYVVGIDIGGTNIRAGMIDTEYGLKNFVIKSSEQIGDEYRAVDRLVDFVTNYMNMNARKEEITAISIGFPATIYRERNRVLSAPNIQGFENVDIVNVFYNKLGIPTYIDRDVNMLMLFDMHNRSIPDEGVTAGFYLGTGLGNAIVIDGQLLRGKNGTAAELGHIPSRDTHGRCGCGNCSCVELFASGKYLQYLCDTYFEDVFIGDIFKKHAQHMMIQKFVNDLAIPVATEINILDPDHIILGGGLPQMEEFPKEALESAIRKYTRKPYPEQNLEFIYSVPNQENGVIGAGIYGIKQRRRGN